MKLNFILFSLILNILLLPAASATSLLPVNLEQLSTHASLVFYGEVINNQVKKDEQSGRIATFTEFKVIDLIKGKTSATHIIKQIGGHLKDSNTTFYIHGIPEFHVGDRHVVFLPEKSALGFSSPLGLQQGSFSVSTSNGEQIISNGRKLTDQSAQSSRNNTLPLPVNAEDHTRSRLYDFINTVRAYNAQ